jgi:hypothetical protein
VSSQGNCRIDVAEEFVISAQAHKPEVGIDIMFSLAYIAKHTEHYYMTLVLAMLFTDDRKHTWLPKN